MKQRMKLGITIDAAARLALIAEADEKRMPLERHISELLEARHAHPEWPDRAEAQALAAEVDRLTVENDRLVGERDRARASAVLHEAEAEQAKLALLSGGAR